MKKILRSYLCAAMLIAAGCSEATAQTKVLKEITSEFDNEYYYYGYNKDNKVDSIYLSYPMAEMSFYRLYTYDEKGNQIQEDNYTDMYSEEYPEFNGAFFVTGRNVYAYDDMNRIISRKSYDLDFDSYDYALAISSATGYKYDENGRLVKEILYYDEAMTMETEVVNYKYDEKGRLSSKELVVSYYEEEEVSKRSVFTYDEQDRLVNICISYLDDYTGTMDEYENINYTYDADGNLVNRSDITTDFENPMLEYRVTYNTDMMAKDVVFPMNYEDETDFYTMPVNAVKSTEIYAIMDYDTGEAGLYDRQNWVYEDGTATGVSQVVSGKKLVNIIVKGDVLMIKGINGATDLRIYDMNGKRVFSGITSGKVNIGSLPAGAYIARTNGTVKKFVVK